MLPTEDLRRLLEATAAGPTRCGLTGPERALLYRLALGTGLRAGEIASLTVGDFRLDADPPVVIVQAAYAKNRRRDELPLRSDLAADLAAYLQGRPATERAFPRVYGPARAAIMLRGDLEGAGIEYETPEGRFDFHSLRHQFCSDLVAAGANVKVAQALARHSTPALTIGRYSHARVHDRKAAVEALPDLSKPTKEPGRERATGTADASPERLTFRLTRKGLSGAISGNARQSPTGTGQERSRKSEDAETPEKQGFRHDVATSDNVEQIGEGGIRTPETQEGLTDFKSVTPKAQALGAEGVSKSRRKPVNVLVNAQVQKPAPADPQLRQLIDAWGGLPEYSRAAIMAIVAAARTAAAPERS